MKRNKKVFEKNFGGDKLNKAIYTNYLYNQYLFDARNGIINSAFGNASLSAVMKETKKVIAVKDVIDKVKDSLEIEGMYVNNTIEEQDTDVKPVLEEMMTSISRIEHSLLFEESNYNDNLNSLENFEIVSQKAIQAQTEVDNNILKLGQIIDTINLEIDEQIEEELECAPLKLKVDKKTFSPNNDGIDDNVTFTITAPKDKIWTLDIYDKDFNDFIQNSNQFESSSEEELEPVDLNDFKKTITGLGTGEAQIINWDGLSNNSIVISNGKYTCDLSNESNKVSKTIKVEGFQDIDRSFISEKNISSESAFSIQSSNSDNTDFYMLPGKCTLLNIGGKYFPNKNQVIKGVAWIGVYPAGVNVPVFGWRENFDIKNISQDNTFKINTFWNGKNYTGGYLSPNTYTIKTYTIKIVNGYALVVPEGSSKTVKADIKDIEIGKLHVINDKSSRTLPNDMENSINAIYSTRSRSEVIKLGDLNSEILNLSGKIRELSKGIEEDMSMYDFGGLLLGISSTIDSRFIPITVGNKYIESSLVEAYTNQNFSNLSKNPDKEYCTNLLFNLGKETKRAESDINKLPKSDKRNNSSEDVFAQIVDSNKDLRLNFSSTIKALSYSGASKVFVAGKDPDAQGRADIEFLDSSGNTIIKRDAKCITSPDRFSNTALSTIKNQLNYNGNIFTQYRLTPEYPVDRLINRFKGVIKNEPCKYKSISMTFVDTKGNLLYDGFPIDRSQCQ